MMSPMFGNIPINATPKIVTVSILYLNFPFALRLPSPGLLISITAMIVVTFRRLFWILIKIGGERSSQQSDQYGDRDKGEGFARYGFN